MSESDAVPCAKGTPKAAAAATSIPHRYAVEQEPTAKEDPSQHQKTLNPKRVRAGWSRGGGLALARRAAHDLLGRGARLPRANARP